MNPHPILHYDPHFTEKILIIQMEYYVSYCFIFYMSSFIFMFSMNIFKTEGLRNLQAQITGEAEARAAVPC